MQIEVPQAIYAMLPAAVTQLVVVLKDTALGSIIMYTDLLQESRRLGSMYFNILQTLVVAAVVYFIVCWLLSVWPNGCRRACSSTLRHRPNRNQSRRSPSWIRPTSTRSPSPRRQGAPPGRRAAHIPCAPSRQQRLDPQLAAHALRAGLRRGPSRSAGWR